jgi:hypothetical protein
MSVIECQECTPVELMGYMMDNYGKEWIGWEPETLWQELEITTASISTEIVRNKLQAIQVVMSGRMFWKDWITFEKICLALNSVPPRFDYIESVSPAQMAYAIVMAMKMRRHPGAGIPGKDPKFSDEVLSYIVSRSYLEGIVYLPKPLDVAQAKLNELTKLKPLAEEIENKMHDPNFEVGEDQVSIGAVRASIIMSYAFDSGRKEI